MDIRLPGYETAFENEVYLKDSELIIGSPEKFKDVLLLSRYTLSTQEQAERCLVESIHNLTSRKAHPDKLSLVERVIEQSLLPETSRHLGVEKCQECLDVIRMLYPGLEAKDEEKLPQYLVALYGIISADFLENNLAAGVVTEAKWFETVLLHAPVLIEPGLGLQFSLSVELENGAFPYYYKKKIISLGAASLHTLENLTEILKHNFDTAGRVNALRDTSQERLEMTVIAPLQEYSKELNELCAEHLAETGKAVKSRAVKRSETTKPEPAEKKPSAEKRTPPAEGRTQPLFGLGLFKKNQAKPEKPN